ncbi:hypothetical protein SAMN05421810_105240 [Amycolatopsis arida]|uniref:Uncharacterized protein n=1 Tax=Amycolatopsis arida TaxID=587909 RepID=A0A1I5WSE6_9PSEU|nr:hypothetical protein [Amycolatopsis arida]TDX92414.1 hypothetical protein CLV69_105259 [Amycolatopsis arida]SFQ22366.1 hypothetical protein SAMN05421810_105240 [Amycolatopsis arida]
MGSPGGGYGVEPEELDQLKKTLNEASDALNMTDFPQRASLEGFLTTQDVSRYEQVEETVEEIVLKLTEFVDRKYPSVVDAMNNFIARAHVTITTTADGVARAGSEYQITEDQVTAWLRRHQPN